MTIVLFRPQVLLQSDDEVLLLEPFFDLYLGQIRLAGGRPSFVPLTPRPDGTWHLDMDLLRRAITPRTRVLVLNSPHNPTGKVFSRVEMEGIAALVRDHPRLVVISDEVYKYIIHAPPLDNDTAAAAGGGRPAGGGALGSEGHIHFAKLPGMWDRTLTVSSAGKTFSVTGWQVRRSVCAAGVVRRVTRLLRAALLSLCLVGDAPPSRRRSCALFHV